MKRVQFLLLAICGAVFWLRADERIGGSNGIALGVFVALIAVVVTVTVAACSRSLPGWRWVLISPVAMAAVTWLTLLFLRPLELYASPAETITPLLQLGYDTGDLCRTVAIAGVGCATWSAGFLLVIDRLKARERTIPEVEPFQMRAIAPWVLIGLGALMSGALFMRQGGFSALLHSTVALHENQGSGFYGQLGIWILIGVALCSLAAVLNREQPSRNARWVLIVSSPLAVASTAALGSRGLVAYGLLAAVVVYMRLRSPSRRRVIIGIAAAVILGLASEFAAVVRTNSGATDLGTAVQRTTETPVAYFQTSDLSTFDDFVVMQQLVPSSISWLHGSSLLQIPAALVPRGIWAGKPQPLDFRVTEYLYPGATAGSPITMQGELFWNFGMPAVAIGGLIIGMLMGWSMVLLFRREALALMLYAVLFPSVFSFLTRALGTMTANTVIGLVGVGVVVFVVNPSALSSLRLPRLRVPSPRITWRA